MHGRLVAHPSHSLAVVHSVAMHYVAPLPLVRLPQPAVVGGDVCASHDDGGKEVFVVDVWLHSQLLKYIYFRYPHKLKGSGLSKVLIVIHTQPDN